LVCEDLSVSLLDPLWFSTLNTGGGQGEAEQQKTFLFFSLILFGFQSSTQEEGEVRLNSRRSFCFSPEFLFCFQSSTQDEVFNS
jgi:hypothetical protein